MTTSFFIDTVEAAIERRAALDLGSGSFKLLVADVDTKTNHIVRYVASDVVEIPLSDKLAKNSEGLFDDEIQAQALTAAKTLLEKAAPYQPVRIAGIATEAFRKAKNGKESVLKIAEALNIPIQLLSQQEEAELGFDSVIEHAKADPDHAVVWDIGGGSFQVSWKDDHQIHSYVGQFGKIPMKNLMIANVKGKSLEETATPNPISEAEMNQGKKLLIQHFEPIPDKLTKKLRDPKLKIYGIGAIHHGNIAANIGKPVYTLAEVNSLLASRLGKSDKDFPNISSPEFWVSDLIFVSGVMTFLGFEEVIDVKSYDPPGLIIRGNTAGLLVTPRFWVETPALK